MSAVDSLTSEGMAIPSLFASRMRDLRPSAIRELLKTTEAPEVISFAGGLPAPELFPIQAISEASQRILLREGQSALQYGVTEGVGTLREWIASHLKETVELEVGAHDVLITHGSQQGLDLIGKVLLDPGDTVIVETPAYLGALQSFQSYQATIAGVPSDDEGIRVEKLEDTVRRAKTPVKFLYLIPNYQNPTGTSLSLARRKQVVALAQRLNLLVVEDDPYGRLRFSGPSSPALGSESGFQNWIYLGSTSKVLAPGLRIGWLVTPLPALFERLVTAKQACDLHTGTFTQRIVAELVQQPGWLDRHIAELITVYRRRRDAMQDALQRHLPKGTRWTKPEGGLFLWVTLPGALDTVELLRRASAHHVAFVPGAPFWIGEAPPTTLRLNFSNASEDRIETGIARLGKLVNSAV